MDWEDCRAKANTDRQCQGVPLRTLPQASPKGLDESHSGFVEMKSSTNILIGLMRQVRANHCLPRSPTGLLTKTGREELPKPRAPHSVAPNGSRHQLKSNEENSQAGAHGKNWWSKDPSITNRNDLVKGEIVKLELVKHSSNFRKRSFEFFCVRFPGWQSSPNRVQSDQGSP